MVELSQELGQLRLAASEEVEGREAELVRERSHITALTEELVRSNNERTNE
jgi:hypothetical protein